MIELDRTNRRLLDLRQVDARQSLEALAAQVDLSATALLRRMVRDDIKPTTRPKLR